MTDEFRRRLEPALADQYTFERELGGGGMSRTYLAREIALNRLVVIKVLSPELLAGISVERFRREVLLAAQLQHPHVVPVLSTGDVDGIPWFSMPYVDGNSLRHRMDEGPVPLAEAVAILRDVARALAYAHRSGVVHRDIKPDNVLLSGGSATVTDFGIAKAISAARTGVGAASATLTQVGTAIGTPAYMAPEQAAGDPDTDHRADLYAFAVMAFELIAGESLFPASAPSKLLLAHMSEPPRHLQTLRPDCPAPLANLVMACLSKDPDGRPQDATAVVRVLDSINTSGSGAAIPAILRGGRIRTGRAVALWAVATAVVALTAWAATDVIDLPDWVLPGAVGVMLAGLPVILFTAFAQRVTQRTVAATPGRTPTHGTMAGIALKASPHLSWRRTWLGGAVAVGAFAALVIGFMVFRALGIGPMASLTAKGALAVNDALVIADFASPEDDANLGPIIAEALRTDLAQSSALRVLTRAAHRDELGLMRMPVDTAISPDLARQIATRMGAKAVLEGNIDRIGSSYVVSARMVTVDNRQLAVFRETASDVDALLAAIGKLSKQVRVKAGESFRAIRASGDLDRVTTASLPALRKYVEALRLADEQGDPERGLALLYEAVEMDTAFAMAWRKIAVLVGNVGLPTAERYRAIEAAYRHRERLTEMEQLLTEGLYHYSGPRPDRAKALAAYEAAIAISIDSTTPALNNAGIIYEAMREYQKAEQLFRKVTRARDSWGGGYTNLLYQQIANGRSGAVLDSTVAAFRARLPNSNDLWQAEVIGAWGKGDVAGADSMVRAVMAAPTTTMQAIGSTGVGADLAELGGRLAESRALTARMRAEYARVAPGVAGRLMVGLDSAYYEGVYGSRTTGLAMLHRAMARVPMDSIPPTERPWNTITELALLLGDADLVRTATAGEERDLRARIYDQVGAQALRDAAVAFAERRWAEAITGLNTADRALEFPERNAAYWLGRAYREMGNRDSAIVHFERFIALRDALPSNDARYLATVRQQLGELYEEQGDRVKALHHYRALVEQWRQADPILQPLLRDLRERIARLDKESG